MKIILGCYSSAEAPEALKLLDLDPATGRMKTIGGCRVTNAIYQAWSPDGTVLYSCTREGLASFKLAAGRFEPIDSIAIGPCVCHVAVMPDGKRVVWADYVKGMAGSVEVEGGHFGKLICHSHSGSGPNLPRQGSAHCHQALPTPDGKSYCVVDLGLDEIITYPEGRVFSTAPAGAGPRHIVFRPDGKLAFVLFELKNLIASLRVGADGTFTQLDTKPTLLPDSPERGPDGDLAAAIRLTPDGKRVVISNRGENSLVAYDFDAATGKLSLVARTLLPGSWPRDFIFVSENLAVVAMERSEQVHSLRYDAATGKFTLLSTLDGFFRPVSLNAAR